MSDGTPPFNLGEWKQAVRDEADKVVADMFESAERCPGRPYRAPSEIFLPIAATGQYTRSILPLAKAYRIADFKYRMLRRLLLRRTPWVIGPILVGIAIGYVIGVAVCWRPGVLQ